MREIKNEFNDEVSFLTKLANTAFNVDPQFNDFEDETNQYARFTVTLSLNNPLFGNNDKFNSIASGVGPTKKDAKLAACISALKALGPEVYREWKIATTQAIENPEETKDQLICLEDKLKQREGPKLNDYTQEQLADFEAIKDAPIDDCTLISTKQ